MPWKTEIDRLVNRVVLDAAKGGGSDRTRAMRTLLDLVQLAPERSETHFHLGTVDELIEVPEEEAEADATEPLPESDGAAARWRHLGRLEAAARRGKRERVAELMDDDVFTSCLEAPEGRVALRAVGRMMLRDGEDERIFGYYTTHLGANDDEGSRRDAEFLLEEALRRADRYDRDGRDEDEVLARLDRAAQFADSAGLEPRAGAKVDRKLGRVHQLAERWDDAVACYRRALDRLPMEDPYRSVLVGDLALATLNVRGTLDLLPEDERETRDAARAILEAEDNGGDGRSYNAIYTLGVLYYEEGNWEEGARSLSEADKLMRENRAKARIVHARSRFFHAHCLIEMGAEDEELEAAAKTIQKDAGPSNLDQDVKDVVFDALVDVMPDARIPGRRRDRRKGRDRDDRGDTRKKQKKSESPVSKDLEKALAQIEEDPMAALEKIDKVFRSRPDFDTWVGAYKGRIQALVELNERGEALRTYERFRSKLYQRSVFDRIETMLLDQEGPLASLLDDDERQRELVDLYAIMPEREEAFVDACVACAQACLEKGEPTDLACAVSMLFEASAVDADGVKTLFEQARAKAAEAGVTEDDADEESTKAKVSELSEPPFILVIGGDEGRRAQLDQFQELVERVGFDGDWILTGARPPQKALEEIEEVAEDGMDAVIVHHGTATEIRNAMERLAGDLDVPVFTPGWLGRRGLERLVLQTVSDICDSL